MHVITFFVCRPIQVVSSGLVCVLIFLSNTFTFHITCRQYFAVSAMLCYCVKMISVKTVLTMSDCRWTMPVRPMIVGDADW